MAALGFLAVAPASATSDTPAFTVDQAQADSYAVGGIAEALSGPILIGPVQPAGAYSPPGVAQFSQAAVADCSIPDAAGSVCISPIVTRLKGVIDTAKTSLASVDRTQCNGSSGTMAPGEEGTKADFLPAPAPTKVLSSFTGANACSNIAHADVLKDPAGTILADAVSVQSLTPDCTSDPRGHVSIAQLQVGGTNIVGPGGIEIGGNVPIFTPNETITIPSVAKIILNEQHYDAHGHGLVVNAIHVFTLNPVSGLVSADVIIGHAHSSAACDGAGATTDTAKKNPQPAALPVVTKTHLPDIAHPGDTISYTLSLAPNSCLMTEVVDTLPPTFSYVAKSASTKDLGTPQVTVLPDGRQRLMWFNPTGLPSGAASTSKAVTETFQVQIASNAAAGLYVNQVDVLSECGESVGQDFFSVPPQRTNCSDPTLCPGVLVTTGAPPPVLINTAGGPPGFPQAGRPGSIQYFLLNPNTGVLAGAVPAIVMIERASTLPTDFLLVLAALAMGAVMVAARTLRQDPLKSRQ